MPRDANTRGHQDSNQTTDRLIHLLKNVGEVISEHDADGRFLYASPSSMELFGRTDSELRGHKLSELVCAEDESELNRLFDEQLKQNENALIHFRICHARGEEFWVETTARTTEEGTIVAVSRQVSPSASDLQEKRVLQHNALDELVTRYKSIINSTQALGIVLTNPEGRIVLQNEYFRTTALLFLNIATRPGDAFVELIPSQKLRNRFLESFETALNGKKVVREFELELNRQHKVFSISYNPVQSVGGGTTGVTLFIRDTTERTLLERKLRQHSASYSQLLNDIDQGIGIVDKDENIIFMNPAGSAIFGFEPGKMEGLNLLDLLPQGEHQSMLEQSVMRQANLSSNYLQWINTRDGEQRLINIYAAPRQNEYGEIQTFAMFHDITEQHDIQKALEFSEKRYHHVIENSPAGVVITDSLGKIEYANQSFCNTLEYDLQDLRGRHFDSVFHGMQESTRTDVDNYEFITHIGVKSKSGKYHHMLMNSAGFNDVNGDLKRAIFLIDNTGHERAEDALKKSQKRYNDLFELSPDAIFTVKLDDGRIVDANASACNLTGYSHHELIAMNIVDLAAEGEDAVVLRDFAHGEQTDNHPIEASFECKDGSTAPVEFRARAIEFQGVPHVLGTFRNMSSRYQEQELNRFQAQLLDAVHQAVIATDLEGKITYWNEHAELLYGWKAEDVVGKPLSAIAPGNERVDDSLAMLGRRSDGRAWSGEGITQRRNGHVFPVYASTSPIYNRMGYMIGTLCVTTDITEQKEFEQSLRKARRDAEQASRAKSQFLANISHEIRTPMNSILGYTDLISNQVEDALAHDYLNTIRSSAEFLMDLLNDVLDLSHIETGQFELRPKPVQPRAILEEIHNIFMLDAQKKKLVYTVTVDPEVPETLMLDELRFRQILMNLVGNATRFTEHGFVHVVLKPEESAGEKGNVGLKITVSDSGVGIPREQQATIFDAFVQAGKNDAANYGGTGLGLAITSRLVHMMNGSISLKSEPGAGSVFTIVLPGIGTGNEAVDKKYPLQNDHESIRFAPARVLLMEDEPFSRRLIREYLRDHPIELIEAENGNMGLEEARKARPDLILLDLRMPVMNGYETLARLKRDDDLAEIPVVVLSASLLEDEEDQALQAGAETFIRKPISRTDLFQTMRQFLNEKSAEE